MNNELDHVSQNLPSTGGDAWGSEGASQDDVMVPRLMLMQDISELVKQQRARSGDIAHSGTGEVLIAKGGFGEIIPITTFREWHIYDLDAKGKEVQRKQGGKILMTNDNHNWPLEGVENGVPIRRKKAISFFVLFVPLIDELPFLVTFKKSNIMVGKQLTTHFKVSEMKKQPPAAQVFRYGSIPKTYDGYTFAVNTIEPARASTSDELAIARKWYDTLKTSEVKVAEEEAVSSNDDYQFQP